MRTVSSARVFEGAGLNHRPLVEGGLLASECADLLRDFFADRRSPRVATADCIIHNK
jgi:tRNA(adenine34) deaminase